MVQAGLLALRVRMWLSARMSFWPSIRLLQPAFPGLPFQVAPVTGCDVLAYSCAAARDLHPLPIGQRVAGLRSCANLVLRKSKNSGPANLPGMAIQSQTQERGWQVARVRCQVSGKADRTKPL